MSLTFVSENLLYPNNLNHENIFDILESMKKRSIDYADIYFESSYKETWVLENNTIKYGSYNIDKGVGVRAIIGEKTGFSYSDKLTLTALNKSAIKASSIILEKTNNIEKNKKKPIKYNTIYSKLNPIESLSRKKKIDILYRINNLARNTDTRVKEVIAILSGVYKQILVAATDGTLVADVRPLIHLSINIHVEQDGKREIGVSGGGGRFGYEFFLENIEGEIRSDIWTREAVRIALVNLYAVESPSGYMPVVLGSGWPGILLHEAVGHGLEGDFNRRGISVFNNKIGKCVASNICTVVDNATIPNLRGSLNIDDEGVPGKLNILIENGYLKGYLQDKLNANLMGVKPTGNGRRESYAHLPIPRMTNTYMMAGNSNPEDIIYSVDKGIYAPNFGSGQVDITSGKFVFSTSEAYLINKGRITKPVKGATLIGSGIEIMKNISMVGNDLELDNGVGLCVKNGQNIPVGVGQPTLKIDKITVGGTA